MSLADFLSAVNDVANRIASQFYMTADELRRLLIANAYAEGGLGETAGIGDSGASYGRFQFNTAGGHGTTLLNQGWTIADFSNEQKVVEHWAPIVANEWTRARNDRGLYGDEAIANAIYMSERPSTPYSEYSRRIGQGLAIAATLAPAPTFAAPVAPAPTPFPAANGGAASAPALVPVPAMSGASVVPPVGLQGSPSATYGPAWHPYSAGKLLDGLGHYWESQDQQWHNENDGSLYQS